MLITDHFFWHRLFFEASSGKIHLSISNSQGLVHGQRLSFSTDFIELKYSELNFLKEKSA